jgi:hypothetical protein
MPYATNRDRSTPTLETTKTPWPVAPLNVFLTSGWAPGAYDIRWDDPSVLALNSRWMITGVNIYRSFDSEFGPFHRVTDIPVGSTFWRDRTDIELIEDELVTPDRWVYFGPPANESRFPQYVFQTQYDPIVKSGSQGIPANTPDDVFVWINNQRARVHAVRGQAGEITLDPREFPNVALQNFDPAVVPAAPDADVRVTYRRLKSLLRTDLAQRVFYRICTVALPSGCDLSCITPNDFVETPLEHAASTSNYEIEKLDYMWRESIRRNRWILEQGGERVRVFLQKHVGLTCVCIPDGLHKQPQADCLRCFGTGVLGGYEGPYETIIAPDDAERRIAQKDIGRTVEHTYEVWTGPIPLLSMRDFLVKINGERYSIGPVRMPTNRGMVLQQHFNIGHLDEKDIRYKVPMDDPVRFAATQFAPAPPEEGGPTPITDKDNIPDERELRGRTLAWENIEY